MTQKSVTVEIRGAGRVLFERSSRARRIVISVRQGKGARVAVPHRVSFREAKAFARCKADWIKKHLEKMKLQREEYPPLRLVTAADREKARTELGSKLRQLAEKHGFSYNRLTVRNQRTRWGSCSAANNISLNMKLLQLPDELIDYVIIHELVHTRIKDHSPRFWGELDRYVTASRKIASRLRKYRLRTV